MSKTIFVDADKAQGRAGTVVTAAFLNAINRSYATGRDVDGEGPLPYAVDAGAVNAFSLVLSPALPSYVAGMPICFKAAADNTGACTININGLGVKAVKKHGAQALAAGDILSGQVVCVAYDGVNFQLLSRGQAQQADMAVAYAVDGGAANAYSVVLSPAPAENTTGTPVFFKAAHANSGASTLVVNGLAAKAIKKRGNLDLQAGDIRAGQVVCVIFDGANYQLFSHAHSGDVLVGSVVKKMSRACPVGYLPISGQALLRAQYPELFLDLVPQMEVALQIANPMVVQAAEHGLSVGDKIRFSTTGTLPTGLSTNLDYYIIAAGFTANSFQVSAAQGGAAVGVSGAQDGVHTMFCWNVCGPGDGLTTFELPDIRGEFFRAWDGGRGVDTDRIFGSFQDDLFKSHTHTQYIVGGSGLVDFTSSGYNFAGSTRETQATGGVETRPKNRAVCYFIKY